MIARTILLSDTNCTVSSIDSGDCKISLLISSEPNVPITSVTSESVISVTHDGDNESVTPPNANTDSTGLIAAVATVFVVLLGVVIVVVVAVLAVVIR